MQCYAQIIYYLQVYMLLLSSRKLLVIINCFTTGICIYYHLNINEHQIELLIHACGIDICYIVASEKPSCLAIVAAACNVSRLNSINITNSQTRLYVLRNEQLWSQRD